MATGLPCRLHPSGCGVCALGVHLGNWVAWLHRLGRCGVRSGSTLACMLRLLFRYMCPTVAHTGQHGDRLGQSGCRASLQADAVAMAPWTAVVQGVVALSTASICSGESNERMDQDPTRLVASWLVAQWTSMAGCLASVAVCASACAQHVSQPRCLDVRFPHLFLCAMIGEAAPATPVMEATLKSFLTTQVPWQGKTPEFVEAILTVFDSNDITVRCTVVVGGVVGGAPLPGHQELTHLDHVRCFSQLALPQGFSGGKVCVHVPVSPPWMR